jgi:magnesium-transporting ATPase (P-type)
VIVRVIVSVAVAGTVYQHYAIFNFTPFAVTVNFVQGNLMRKILYATERVVGDGDSTDTSRFIAVLVCFAVLASAYVLYCGVGDERRNQFRLALHCIMIVTSVVPPELPMELSLAVRDNVMYCTSVCLLRKFHNVRWYIKYDHLFLGD